MKVKTFSTETVQDIKITERYFTAITLIGEYDYLEATEYHAISETINIIDSVGKVVEQISKTEKKDIISIRRFDLHPITRQQLLDFRKKRIPSFVLKKNGKFFYTEIDPDISFLSSDLLGHHMCSLAPDCCTHLSAASDEEGGCAKVRNMARYIERYPWITCGYETFNTKCDTFMVAECNHYERFDRKTKTLSKVSPKKKTSKTTSKEAPT